MYYDALTAAAVADELVGALVGGFVQRMSLPTPLSVALEVYAHRERHELLLSAEPGHPRVALVSQRPTAQPGLVTPFGLLLRKYVLDGVIEEVEQPPGERVIALSIANRAGGLNTRVWVHAELMGRHSNLMLLDGERETILESVKRVTPEMSSVRPILPKRPFVPPPPRKGLAPHRVLPDDLRQLAAGAKPSGSLAQLLVSGVSGLSPLAAREIVYCATGDAETLVRDWDDWPRLATELRRLASLWATRDWTPCVATAEDDVLAYAPYELTHLRGRAELEFPASISAAIERYGGASMAAVVSHGQLRGQILAALEKRADRVRQKLESLERERKGAEDAQRLMEDGQLVLAYAYSLEPGQEILELEDRTIRLDPTLSAAENAQGLFDAYKRRKRAGEDLPARIEEARRELAAIEEYRTFADLAQGHAELTALRAEAVEAGAIREDAAKAASTRKAPVPKLETLTAPDGTRILVGRSAAQNARVLDAAAPHDWWFHAREIPGGHVVARTGGREPSGETLRMAAETAAYNSAARESGTVEVVYCQFKDVRKIKGAGPGQVTYRNERSVRVEPRDHSRGVGAARV
jgi:predicted ribosome quality control (RQC) complex YloA/Tae2 family protein